MARFLSRDGRWRVDLIRLAATSDQRDGERLRVHRDGFFFAEYRSVAELAEVVDLAELEEALARGRGAGAAHRRRVRQQPAGLARAPRA